jgi:hypothetical protein
LSYTPSIARERSLVVWHMVLARWKILAIWFGTALSEQPTSARVFRRWSRCRHTAPVVRSADVLETGWPTLLLQYTPFSVVSAVLTPVIRTRRHCDELRRELEATVRFSRGLLLAINRPTGTKRGHGRLVRRVDTRSSRGVPVAVALSRLTGTSPADGSDHGPLT